MLIELADRWFILTVLYIAFKRLAFIGEINYTKLTIFVVL